MRIAKVSYIWSLQCSISLCWVSDSTLVVPVCGVVDSLAIPDWLNCLVQGLVRVLHVIVVLPVAHTHIVVHHPLLLLELSPLLPFWPPGRAAVAGAGARSGAWPTSIQMPVSSMGSILVLHHEPWINARRLEVTIGEVLLSLHQPLLLVPNLGESVAVSWCLAVPADDVAVAHPVLLVSWSLSEHDRDWFIMVTVYNHKYVSC